MYRMKNHNPYTAGIPDCWYSGNAGDLWVEYKFMTIPKRSSTIVDFCGGKVPMISALQQKWLRDRYNEGRTVGVIIGTPEGGVWLSGISWEVPLQASERFSTILDKSCIAAVITDIVYRPPNAD